MKNTYIIRHKGKTYISNNIMLNSYRDSIIQGVKVTDYLAFGSGTGMPSITNYSLFSFLGVKECKTIEYNADCQKGEYYVLKSIVLGADEFVGQTITEVGFCPSANQNLITHSILPQGVYKDNEPMEISAYFYFAYSNGLLEGDNPLVKALLGIMPLNFSMFSYGYCNYYSIADAQNITNKHPCQYAQNVLRLICANQSTKLKDLVLFYDDVPVMTVNAFYNKVNSTSYNYTFDNKGLITVENFADKKAASCVINGIVSVFGIQAVITGISSNIQSLPIDIKGQKIVVSKDRQYLVLIHDNEMQVYRDFNGKINYIGKAGLETHISYLDICAGRIIAVCNQKDTPLSVNNRRLYFFDISSGIRLTEKTFTNDLDMDIDGMSLEFAGANNMILYVLSGGLLIGKTFCYTDKNPVLTDNCSFEAPTAKFFGASYRRNTVFATNLNKDDMTGTVHKALLNGENNPLYSGIILNLKSISPEQMLYTGEAILTYSATTKTVAVYSYVNNSLKVFELNNLISDIDKVFLDCRYIFVTDINNTFYLYEIDYDLCELKLTISGANPMPSAEQVLIMNDLILFINQNSLISVPVTYSDVNIYSDQSAYLSSASIRFSNTLYGDATGYNSLAATISFTF